MVLSRRHSDDALISKGLDLLWPQLVLLVAVAQPAQGSHAPAPNGAAAGDGEAVVCSSRHAHGALTQRGRETGRRDEPRHALAVAEQPGSVSRTAARREPPLAVDEEAEPSGCRRPRRWVGLAQERSEAQPPHGAALALWLRRQLEAALSRPQADALFRERGVEEQRDGRDASDVGGDAARDDAREELRGEVGEGAVCGGGGGGGEAARAAPQNKHRHEKNFTEIKQGPRPKKARRGGRAPQSSHKECTSASIRRKTRRIRCIILDCVPLQMLAGSQREKLAALIESSAARAAETLKQEAEEHDDESSFESIADAQDISEMVPAKEEDISAAAPPAVAPESPTTAVPPSPQSDLAAQALPSPEPPPPPSPLPPPSPPPTPPTFDEVEAKDLAPAAPAKDLAPAAPDKEPAPAPNKRPAAPRPVLLGLLLLLASGVGLGLLFRPSAVAVAVATPAPPPPHAFVVGVRAISAKAELLPAITANASAGAAQWARGAGLATGRQVSRGASAGAATLSAAAASASKQASRGAASGAALLRAAATAAATAAAASAHTAKAGTAWAAAAAANASATARQRSAPALSAAASALSSAAANWSKEAARRGRKLAASGKRVAAAAGAALAALPGAGAALAGNASSAAAAAVAAAGPHVAALRSGLEAASRGLEGAVRRRLRYESHRVSSNLFTPPAVNRCGGGCRSSVPRRSA